jgi:hypothetical protein
MAGCQEKCVLPNSPEWLKEQKRTDIKREESQTTTQSLGSKQSTDRKLSWF